MSLQNPSNGQFRFWTALVVDIQGQKRASLCFASDLVKRLWPASKDGIVRMDNEAANEVKRGGGGARDRTKKGKTVENNDVADSDDLNDVETEGGAEEVAMIASKVVTSKLVASKAKLAVNPHSHANNSSVAGGGGAAAAASKISATKLNPAARRSSRNTIPKKI